jgi:hypothetical protein
MEKFPTIGSAILAALFLFPRGALADAPVPDFCGPTNPIPVRARICPRNILLVQTGKACQQKFDKYVESLSNDLRAHAPAQSSPGTTQSAQFDQAAGEYRQGIATLDAAIAANKLALQRIEWFAQLLIHPVDDTDLLNVPCYADNRNGLVELLKGFRSRLAQLEGAKKEALANGAGSLSDESGVKSAASQKRLAPGKTAPAFALPRFKDSNNQGSNVTGVEEDEAKEKRFQQP